MTRPEDLTDNPRMLLALRGELGLEELTLGEQELFFDLVAYMPPSEKSKAFFARMRENGGAVGLNEQGQLVRLLPGGKEVPIDVHGKPINL